MDRREFLIRSILGATGFTLGKFDHGNAMSSGKGTAGNDPITLFLAGDVMTGRGVDQILPYSVDPKLHEIYVKDARRYLQLAKDRYGPIPDEVSFDYIWGDGLEVLEQVDPEVRIINLETAVTDHPEPWPKKRIHYRMHPGNTPILSVAGIDICVLDNNHAMDWGRDGLKETLKSIRDEGVQTAGAGLEERSAAEPAIMETGKGRLLVFAYATPGAGAPMSWSAAEGQPGVNILPDLNAIEAKRVTGDVEQYKKKNDRVVVSLHWGPNWGYDIPKVHRDFARRLIDENVADLIYGHSSHHPKGIEVYNGRPILYGCGDLINDYEGISGHEQYRGDLSLMYFPTLDGSGRLASLQMAPMRIRQFRLHRAPEEDAEWLAERLDRECRKLGTRAELDEKGSIVLRWE